MLNIQNRRYLGSKRRLLPFIANAVKEENIKFDSFVDLFAGTGIMGEYFNTLNRKIIVNDLLYCNYLAYITWLSNKDYDREKIRKYISELNHIKGNDNNYISKNFSGTYFTYENAIKIGNIREEIEKRKKDLTFREYAILITSLIYTTDSVANTFGHYAGYSKTIINKKQILLKMPIIKSNLVNKYNEIYNVDANRLALYLKGDLVYIDPPYNSRQYATYYHLLENIARWDKPKLIGKTLRPIYINNIKSEYCTKNAKDVFQKLITNLDCKYIIVSYNNANNDVVNNRSAYKIDLDTMKNILGQKGKLNIHETNFNNYQTTPHKINNYKERLFICKVN